MDERVILEMFCRRDEAALIEVRRSYGLRLHKTALNILQNNEDAEECVNDALLRAWEAIPPVLPEKLGAYLVKIVRNLALNRWEARTASKRGGGATNLLLDELAESVPTTAYTPEEALEASFVTAAINNCLSNMKRPMRAAFVLRYFHGESIAGICKHLQISESKTKSLLHRARKILRENLEKEGINV